MDGQYLLMGELVALLTVLLSPALLMAFFAQGWYLRKIGLPFSGNALCWAITFVVTCVLTVAGVIGLVRLQAFPSILGIAWVGDRWPVSPIAYVLAAVVAPIVAWVVCVLLVRARGTGLERG